MSSFQKYYRTLYRTIGYPLGERAGLPTALLARAERRLGVRAPAALRAYYLVAGRDRRFNARHNRLLPPFLWAIDQNRLIFMEENQTVVRWSVSTRSTASDPAVSQGINDEPIAWYPEHRKCSVFLAVMLHYQAVSGGLRFIGGADAPRQSDYRFEKRGWTCYGEVNSLQAYSRQNQVVCLLPSTDLPFGRKWTVLAGGKTKADLLAIESELGVSLA
jgi:hypothetical protein